MRKALITISLIILSAMMAQAQSNWTRLENETKEFSAAVPAGFQVMIDQEGYDAWVGEGSANSRKVKISNIRTVLAYENGASFLVESQKVSNLKDALLDRLRNSGSEVKTTQFKSKDFIGYLNTNQQENSYSMELIVGHNDRLYRIFGGAHKETNETLRHFIASFRLNGTKFFKLVSPLENKITESGASLFSALTETPFTVEFATDAEKRELEKQEKEKKTKPDETAKKENQTPLFIISKPQARYTDKARMGGTVGNIHLRVTFSENGAIEKIVVHKKLNNGLTDQAVRAARVIRFLPKEVDGKPVATTRTIIYTFSIY